MILSPTLSPDRSIYHLASFVLEVLLKRKHLPVDRLYRATIRLQPMTYDQFAQCLDWLYLIGAINLNNNQITLCS